MSGLKGSWISVPVGVSVGEKVTVGVMVAAAVFVGMTVNEGVLVPVAVEIEGLRPLELHELKTKSERMDNHIIFRRISVLYG